MIRMAKKSDKWMKLTPGSLHELQVCYGEKAKPSVILETIIDHADLTFVWNDKIIFGVVKHNFFFSWGTEHAPVSFYKELKHVLNVLLEQRGYLHCLLLMEDGGEKGIRLAKFLGAKIGKPFKMEGKTWCDTMMEV